MTALPRPRPPFPRRAVLFVAKWALAYCGIIVVFLFLERSLVFRPDRTWHPPAWPWTVEVSFPAADGSTVHAWWVPPERPGSGAFLIACGNGGNMCYREPMAVGLRRATGLGALVFDYPGYGQSAGSPTEAGCYAAGEAAYRWLGTEAGVTADRLVLFGESLGGGTAVELATRHDHRALLLLYTFTTLPAAAKYHYPFLPTHTLMRTRFDNLSKVGRCRRPVFIAHGTDDRVVPFAHGEALLAAANPPKEFLRMEGVGHALPDGDGFYQSVARFLREHAP